MVPLADDGSERLVAGSNSARGATSERNCERRGHSFHSTPSSRHYVFPEERLSEGHRSDANVVARAAVDAERKSWINTVAVCPQRGGRGYLAAALLAATSPRICRRRRGAYPSKARQVSDSIAAGAPTTKRSCSRTRLRRVLWTKRSPCAISSKLCR